MKLVGKVPVEPLDDERLTNIERNLVVAVSDMKAPAPRRSLAFAAVAMAIALAGFAGWKLHRAPAAVPPTPQTFALKSETDRAMLDLGDAQLASAPGTDVKIERVPTSTSIMMAKGTLDLVVDHKPGRLFVVHAGDTAIEDVGTKFSVVFDGKSHVEVRVTEGEVMVRRGGKDFSVTANNAWTTELGTTTIAQLDSTATTNVVAHNDVVIEQPVVEPNRGSASGSGAGSGSASKRPRKSGIKEAILAVPLSPLAGSMAELNDQLLTATGDKSMLMYSIAVSQHVAKNDGAALYSIKGPLSNRMNDAAYKDAMWLSVRIHCLKALDDSCRVAAGRYLNSVESGHAAGVAQEILKQIAL